MFFGWASRAHSTQGYAQKAHGDFNGCNIFAECCRKHDSVSEWLRRWTRNPLGSAREGSNPFAVALVLHVLLNAWPGAMGRSISAHCAYLLQQYRSRGWQGLDEILYLQLSQLRQRTCLALLFHCGGFDKPTFLPRRPEENNKYAHAGSRTRVTSMGGLYDAVTLHALVWGWETKK